MSCPQRSSIVTSSTPADLEILRNKAISEIHDSLYQKAQVGTPSISHQMRIATAGVPQIITISPEVNIIELNLVDIVANYRRFPIRGGRGLHDPQTGKIVLCQGRWCVETLLHETLHSLSFSSVRQDLYRPFLNFFEGLTEFFAGYIMFRHYPTCYDAWKEQRYSFCSVTYLPIVRLLAAFCRFIPVSEFVKLYFWNGTNDWEARCKDFLDAIHQAGYPQFEDFTKRRGLTIEMKILEECIKSFGMDRFRTVYDASTLKLLDFENMLCSSLPLALL